MARINEQVIFEVTGTGVSPTYKYRKRKGHDILAFSVAKSDGSAFTSTLVLETATPDGSNWVTLTDGTFTNAEGSGTIVPGGNADYRWNCTAYTDTVVVRLG